MTAKSLVIALFKVHSKDTAKTQFVEGATSVASNLPRTQMVLYFVMLRVLTNHSHSGRFWRGVRQRGCVGVRGLADVAKRPIGPICGACSFVPQEYELGCSASVQRGVDALSLWHC